MVSPSHPLTMPTFTSMLLLALFLLLSGDLAPRASAQQPYGSAIADCANPHNDTGMLGYFCGGRAAPSCPTYLTFTARAPYTTPASIAALLGADAAAFAAANSVGETSALAPGTRVLVPTTCSCTSTPEGRFYQRNASYVVRDGDILLNIAKDTFQGLATCQALQAQGDGGRGENATNVLPGKALTVPLRCACPTVVQVNEGARFLVSYLVGSFDEVRTVAARFGVEEKTVAEANQLQAPFTIFPETTLLIPVAAPPNVSQIQSPPPPPPPPPVAATTPATKNSKHTGVYIGVGVAVAAVAVIAAAGTFLALKARRRRTRQASAVLAATSEPATKGGGKLNSDKSALTSSTFTTGGVVSASFSDAFSSSVISVSDIKSSLKVYTFAELRAATDDFSPDRRINGGSVYRATFNGDAAAVEIVDRDVSAEVEIMRKINHLNLVRLVGLGHHHGRWYLVTEFAEHGALRDQVIPSLSWTQRVQVALDVAEGLRYLHEYADPPCVHMDVSSGTVLLAGDGPRAKLRGFAAARAISSGGTDGEVVFTMTSQIAGTRGYLAPEYLEHGVVSPKADVYALGVVMLELVTGNDVEELVGDGVGDPFAELRELVAEERELADDVVLRRQLEELLDPALPVGSVPQDAVLMMVRLIERCVRRNAANRPSTGEVAQHLLKLSGVSVVNRQSSRDPESPRSPGR